MFAQLALCNGRVPRVKTHGRANLKIITASAALEAFEIFIALGKIKFRRKRENIGGRWSTTMASNVAQGKLGNRWKIRGNVARFKLRIITATAEGKAFLASGKIKFRGKFARIWENVYVEGLERRARKIVQSLRKFGGTLIDLISLKYISSFFFLIDLVGWSLKIHLYNEDFEKFGNIEKC